MGRQRRVLLVDDDLDVLYYVDDLLQELGYRPVKATSAEEAAEQFETKQVDAVMIGFSMIPAAASGTIEQLAPADGAMPVLVMAKPDMRPEGDSSPLRCFLDHPPGLPELEDALERYLGEAR
jgi:DNA-binding NtrC family response regulator